MTTILGTQTTPSARSRPPPQTRSLPLAEGRGDAAFGSCAGSANGSAIRNVVPRPGSDSTETLPPWASATAATIDSPSPTPPLARDRDSSAR